MKLFATIAFTTGACILLFSLVAHSLMPANLIQASFIGGIVGLIAAIYFSFRQKILKPVNIFPVLLCTLLIFGLFSFFVVFNFNHPFLILSCFLFVAITTVFAKHLFTEHFHYSKNKFYGLIGILFLLPALYFLVASLLKFQGRHDFLFAPIDVLLRQKHGQENFNAITPFLFGGGILLAFILNLFSQLQVKEDNRNIFHYNIAGFSINLFNLVVLLLAVFAGLIFFIYIIAESIK
jgi:hypothetical protein